MKKQLLFFSLLLLSLTGLAQTQNALPTGSVPYGSQYYIAPDASVWVGTTAKKFRRITESKTLDSLLTVLNSNVLHTTGTETKTGRLILTSPAATQGQTGGMAIAPLTVTGANGGGSTATSGTGIGGLANEIVIQGGSGGSVPSMTTGTAISGSGAAMTFRGGDGGNISGTPTTKIFGSGGTPVIQGGSAFGTGQSGDVEIKSGNNVTTGSLVRGGNVFLTTGWGNNDPSDNPLYNGTLFLNVTRSLAVRGNTVIGNAVDDYTNRLQVTGNTKITGKAIVTVAPTAAQDVVRKQELDAVAAGSVTNLAIGTVTTTTVPVTNSNGTGFTIPAATTSLAGVFSSTDKTKLNGIATGATANQTDAFLLARANHTGTQAISTVTNLQTTLDAKEDEINKGAANGYAGLDASSKLLMVNIPDALVGSVNYQGNYNASTNSPALPTATGNKGYYYVVSVAGTQESLTFAVGDWIISNGTIWQKVDNNNAVTSVAGKIGSVTLVKGDVGLGNVDNTSDVNKPVSTAQQTALNLKEDLTNKSNVTTLGTSSTLYPTQNAVKVYVDNAIAGNTGASNLAVGTRTTTTVPVTNSNGTGFTLPEATTSLAGVLNSSDKTKLNSVTSGASVSSVALTAPTGLTVSGSPVTTTGTLGLTYTAGYAIPTTAKQADWDTAFGWGDYRQFGLGASALTTDYNTAPSYTFLRNNNLSTANAPTAGVHSVWTTGNALNLNASGQGAQFVLGYSNAGGNYAPPEIYLRSKIAATTWGSWYKVFSESNFTPGNYVLKAGDTMTGSLTAPTFIGNLSGNASTASTASFSTTAAAGDNSVKIATTQFVQQELGDYLPLAGGTLTGNLLGTTSSFSGNVNSQGAFVVNRAGATSKGIFSQTSASNRWFFGANATSESGSNLGSNFVVERYSDAGASLGNALTIERNSGNASFSGNVISSVAPTIGSHLVNKTALDAAVADYLPLTAGTGFPLTGELLITKSAAGITLKNIAGAVGNTFVQFQNNAGTRLGYVGLPSVGNNNMAITADLAAITYNGTSHIFNSQITGTSAVFSSSVGATQNMTITGAAATIRSLGITTAGSQRWLVYANSDAESGSSAGSTFAISRYNDAGSFLGSPITIARATGAITVESTISGATAPTSANHYTNKTYVDAQSVVGAFDEGNGIGYRLRSSNSSFYGNIGLGAVDFTSATSGTTFGATGDYSFSSGQTTTASGTGSTAIGTGSSASGVAAVAMGNLTQANGSTSVAMGNAVIMGTDNGFGFGQYNDNTGGHIFTIGNGPNGASRSNAYDLTSTGNSRQSGTATATQFRVSALNTAPASATATGTTGEIRITATHIYICTATNTWVRAALATW